MDSENHYKVTFSGEIVSGKQLEQVKVNLARLFKSSDATIEKLFSGPVMTIKKYISEKQALNYQRAMEKAGAIAHLDIIEELEVIDLAPPPVDPVEPIGSVEPAEPEPEVIPVYSNSTTPDNIQQNIVESRLAAPPVITDYSDEDEYAAPPPAAVTNAAGPLGIAPADQWKIDELGVRMSRPKRHRTKSAPNIDYLDLSPPKSDMGQTKRHIETVNPDTSHLDIAATGTRLSDEVTKEKPDSPNTSYLDVAEIGADMGQAKHEQNFKDPDTSQLSIDESAGNIKQLKHLKEAVNPDTSYLNLQEN